MNTEGRFIRKKDITDNVATFVYDYNSLGRLTAMSHTSDGFEESYAYEYDAAGNRLKTTKTSVRNNISGSNIYESKISDSSIYECRTSDSSIYEYGYDSYGNRTIKEDFESGGLVTTYAYNANNQLVTGITGDLEEVYGYDKRGNLTSVTSGGNLIKSYTFDHANRMTSATEHGEDSR